MCGGAIISEFIVAKRGRELPTHDLWSELDTDDLFSFPAAVTSPHLNSGSAGGEKSIWLKKRGAGPGKEEYEYLKMSIEGYLTAYYAQVAGLYYAITLTDIGFEVHIDNFLENVKLELFDVLAKQATFHQLRSVEQLGYITTLIKRNYGGIRGGTVRNSINCEDIFLWAGVACIRLGKLIERRIHLERAIL